MYVYILAYILWITIDHYILSNKMSSKWTGLPDAKSCKHWYENFSLERSDAKAVTTKRKACFGGLHQVSVCKMLWEYEDAYWLV